MDDSKSDADVFGDNAWIYCKSHLAPHTTGWCTVHIDQKVLLNAKDRTSAIAECKERGLYLFNYEPKPK